MDPILAFAENSGALILHLQKPPMVKVELDLIPEQMRALARMYLLSAKGVRHDHEGINGVFRTEVPRGMYAVGAKALNEEFKELLLEDQELIPPIFPLTMQAQ